MAKRIHSQHKTRPDADRRVRQAERMADHLRLLQLLLGRGRWDAKSLAAELQCTERTVYRYLKVLEFAGVAYFYDRERQCYCVRPDVKFPVLQLTPDELLNQATATAVMKVPGLDAAGDVRETLHKLSANSGEEVAQLLADAQNMMAALDLKLADHRQHHEILKTIQWALIERKQLEGDYYSPHQKQRFDLTLCPYRLCLAGQAWYLIARPVTEAEPKTYRVMRFHSVRMLSTPAEPPGDFDLANYFRNAWVVYRGDKSYEVAIEFTADVADLVTETVWHKTQLVQHHSGGGVTLSFLIDGLDEIAWWILSWSGKARVLKPDALRQRVVQQLRTALKLNEIESSKTT